MKICVSSNWLSVVESEIFVAGSVGVYHVEFDFDSSWDEYTASAIFEISGQTSIEMLVENGICEIPWEVLADTKKKFRIGIYGVKKDARRPTLWTEYFAVAPGTSTGVAARPDPSPDIYEQLIYSINQVGSAKYHADAAEASAKQSKTNSDLAYDYANYAAASSANAAVAAASSEQAQLKAEDAKNEAEEARAVAVERAEGIVESAEIAAAQAQAAADSAQEASGYLDSVSASADLATGASVSADISRTYAYVHESNAKTYALGGALSEATTQPNGEVIVNVGATRIDGAKRYSEKAQLYAEGGRDNFGMPRDVAGAKQYADASKAYTEGGSYQQVDMFERFETVTVAKGAKQYAEEAAKASNGIQDALNDARSASSSAISSASLAQSSANEATSSASKATASANTAQANAGYAVSAADRAQSEADRAKAEADRAASYGGGTVNGLPDHTAADNGKFLRIVDGAPAWATVQNIEEVEF